MGTGTGTGTGDLVPIEVRSTDDGESEPVRVVRITAQAGSLDCRLVTSRDTRWPVTVADAEIRESGGFIGPGVFGTTAEFDSYLRYDVGGF